jgi:sialic acid synthase SpsE
VSYERELSEQENLVFRRSLYAVADIPKGGIFTEANVRSIRPGYGLAPKHLPKILGKCAAQEIPRGTPISFAMIG